MFEDARTSDGSEHPLGYVTPDGELEVREVDGVRGFHETPLGQHQRWMKQAPDLYELYHKALENRPHDVLPSQADRISAETTHERLRAMTDWTQGYREVWLHVRGGIAWTLLGWAMAAFHPNDLIRVEVARALEPICDRELREEP